LNNAEITKHIFNSWDSFEMAISDRYIMLFLDYDGTLVPIVDTPDKAIISKENLALYEKYKKLADLETGKGVHFVGRLANYKYFNMDQAFANALDLFYSLNPHLDKTASLDYNKVSDKA